jgi:hypothetical protein
MHAWSPEVDGLTVISSRRPEADWCFCVSESPCSAWLVELTTIRPSKAAVLVVNESMASCEPALELVGKGDAVRDAEGA